MTDTDTISLSQESQHTITSLWGLSPSTFKIIKYSENHTYLVTTQENRFILRLTPESHRTKNAIQSELDFIFLLSKSSLHLCTPITHSKGEYIGIVAPYDDKKLFYGVLFVHAKGVNVVEKWIGLFDDKMIASLGRTMAEMHNFISKKAENEEKWSQMEKYIPSCDQTHGGATKIELIKTRAEEGHETSKILLRFYQERLSPFLKSCGECTSDRFGVIHGDLNVSNYFAEDDTLWIFDFDQVHKNWFGFDIGVVLQMSRYFDDSGIAQGFNGDHFRKIFLDGYKSVSVGMLKAGHLEPHMLQGFEDYREFFQASVAVDILFQVARGQQFQQSITSFCESLVKRFQSKFDNKQ